MHSIQSRTDRRGTLTAGAPCPRHTENLFLLPTVDESSNAEIDEKRQTKNELLLRNMNLLRNELCLRHMNCRFAALCKPFRSQN